MADIQISKNAKIVNFCFSQYMQNLPYRLYMNIDVNRNDHSFSRIIVRIINHQKQLYLASNEDEIKTITIQQIEGIVEDINLAKKIYAQIYEVYDLAKAYDVREIDLPKITYESKNLCDEDYLIDVLWNHNGVFRAKAFTNDFDISDTLRVYAVIVFRYAYGELYGFDIAVYNRTIGQRAQSKGNVFNIFSERTKNLLTMDEKEFDKHCQKFAKSKQKFKHNCFESIVFTKTIKELFFQTRKDFLIGKQFVDLNKDKYESLKIGI